MPDQVTLTIETPGAEPQTFTVEAQGEITIGRDEACTVVLASPDISRKHLTLDVSPTNVQVRDSSSNGTRIGNDRVHRNAIRVPFRTPMYVGPYIVRVDGLERSGTSSQSASAHAHVQSPPRPGPPPHPPPHGQSMGSVPKPPLASSGSTPSVPSVPPGGGPRTSVPTMGNMPAVGGLGGYTGEQQAVRPAASVATRKRIHRSLLEHLDLAAMDRSKMDERVMRPRVRDALKRIVQGLSTEIPQGTDVEGLINELTDEALGLGPLEHFLADPTISEIMVVDAQTIFVERKGRLVRADARFTDDEAVRAVIERIVTPLGRRIDESTPLVDARLKDGSRVNAVIKPLALKGSCITIRKFSKNPLRLDDLVRFGGMTEQMAKFLTRSVTAKKNIVISGGTGSGKTTLLNVLSAAIPAHERIVTIEDAAELQLAQPHVVSLESRPPNMEGRGEYTIRDLVKNALRMRPDRIVVGECRGGEALDMLQAMNTGHDGSLTTTHSNSPREAVARLETLSLMSGLDLPVRAIREQIANSVHLVVQQSRFTDGSRKVTAISEVVGLADSGEVDMREIFSFVRTGTGAEGKVMGEFRASGYLPSFLDVFISYGLVPNGDYL